MSLFENSYLYFNKEIMTVLHFYFIFSYPLFEYLCPLQLEYSNALLKSYHNFLCTRTFKCLVGQRSTLKLRQYFSIRGDKNWANSRGRYPSILQHSESAEITYIKRTAVILTNKENGWYVVKNQSSSSC